MIGTQKMQDNYDGEFKTQTGTIICSFAGGVTIAAGDTAHLTTTDIIGKTGVTIAAQDSILDGKQNEAYERQTHEESTSGLTISLRSPVIEVVEGAHGTIRTAQTRDNKTLQALEAYEGGKTPNDQVYAIKRRNIMTRLRSKKNALLLLLCLGILSFVISAILSFLPSTVEREKKLEAEYRIAGQTIISNKWEREKWTIDQTEMISLKDGAKTRLRFPSYGSLEVTGNMGHICVIEYAHISGEVPLFDPALFAYSILDGTDYWYYHPYLYDAEKDEYYDIPDEIKELYPNKNVALTGYSAPINLKQIESKWNRYVAKKSE